MAHEHTILAIDPGSRCGWALWRDDMRNPVYGSWLLEWGSDGQRMLGLQRKLKQMDSDYGGLTQVVMEHNPHVHMGERAVALGYGWLSAVQIYCAARRIPFKHVTTEGGWRIEFIGRQNKALILRREKRAAAEEGRKSKTRDVIKAATIERCEQLGWKPKDDNEADALGLLDSYLKDIRVQAPWQIAETLRPMSEVVR